MCGIAGVRRYGKEPITAEEIKVLLCRLQHRGMHATGIALMVDGEIKIIKAPVPAWNFVADKDTNEFLDAFLPEASMALLHTRAATIGSPADNNNNHPMFLGDSAVVHNGGVHNHADLFGRVLKVDRSAETDSDVFRAIIDKHGMNRDAVKVMNQASGSAAIAAMSQSEPDKLLLARSGSPLVYAISDTKLWWASEIQAIQHAVRPWVKHHGLFAREFRQAGVGYFRVPDHTAYLLGGDEPEAPKFEFKICTAYNAPNYAIHRENYHTKAKEWIGKAGPLTKVEAKEYTHKSAPCPNKECASHPEIPVGEKFKDYECMRCKRNLGALDLLKEIDITFLKR